MRWCVWMGLAISSPAFGWDLGVGAYGGALIPDAQHELYDPTRITHLPLATGPQFGLRAEFFPVRPFGLNVEGGRHRWPWPTAVERWWERGERRWWGDCR